MRLSLALTASTIFVPLVFITPAQIAVAEIEPDHSLDPEQDRSYEHFYVGVDGFDVLQTGTYAGLENPNHNRLTFLFSHVEEDPTTNHFHGIGAYSYSGSVDSPVISSTNTNNRIPEPYTELPPITLHPGTGMYTDRLVSMPSEEEYTNLKMEPVAKLQNNASPGAGYLFNSSNGRWNDSLGSAVVGLELVSISDGLNIANEQGENILTQVGDIHTIGSGDDFAFTPTFWADSAAPAGDYSATFRLKDLNNSLEESGTFSIDFQVASVPEPTSLLGIGAFGLLAFLGKRRLKSSR